ncbi:MAG: NADH-quinone oxidoreductase subunit J [Pseudomonadota bacterium]
MSAAETLPVLAFYMFSSIAVISALMVVIARNPVRAVLWLILAFFSAAGLFLLLGAEFLAMILVIVYVGAVMVLFLFVVMMLDVDFAELRQGMSQYLPLGAVIGLILLIQIALVVGSWVASGDAVALRLNPSPDGVDNTKALGLIIYDDYALLFQLSGLILLVAMIGAIALTLRQRDGVKRQNPVAQMHRSREEAVQLKDVKPGQGIN